MNNDYFDLQRSADGVHFYSIAWIDGAGTSNQLLFYSYKDADITSGLVYYKLAQSDYDGTVSYSKIIAMNLKETIVASVW